MLTRQRVIVSSALGIPNQKRPVIVFRQQQFLFGLDPLDLAEIPRLRFDGLELGHVIGRDVALLFGRLAPGQPPVALRVVQYLQVFALPEAQVLVGARIVIVQGDEYLGRRVIRFRDGWHGPVPGHAYVAAGRRDDGRGRGQRVLVGADVGRRTRDLLLAGRAPLAAEATAHLAERGGRRAAPDTRAGAYARMTTRAAASEWAAVRLAARRRDDRTPERG